MEEKPYSMNWDKGNEHFQPRYQNQEGMIPNYMDYDDYDELLGNNQFFDPMTNSINYAMNSNSTYSMNNSNQLNNKRRSKTYFTQVPKKTKVLLICIYNKQGTIITHDILYRNFSKYGEVNQILIFEKSKLWKAFIEMSSVEAAEKARTHLNDFPIINDGSNMNVYPSNMETLNFQNNNSGGVDYTLLFPDQKQLNFNTSNGGTIMMQSSPNAMINTHNNNYSMNLSTVGSTTSSVISTTVKKEMGKAPDPSTNQYIESGFKSVLDFDPGKDLTSIFMMEKNTNTDTFKNSFLNNTKSEQVNHFAENEEQIEPSEKDIQSRVDSTIANLDYIMQKKNGSSTPYNHPLKNLDDEFDLISLNDIPTVNSSNRLNMMHDPQISSDKTMITSTTGTSTVGGTTDVVQQSLPSDPNNYVNPLFILENKKSRVIYVRGLESDDIDVNQLFNLFSNFGNIYQIIFLRVKRSALIEYQYMDHAMYAKDYMNGHVFLGHQMRIFYSNYDSINLREENQEQQSDDVLICNDSLKRFKNDKAMSINPPSQVLHVSNLKKDACNQETIAQLFKPYGVEVVKIITQNNFKYMSLVRLESVEKALEALSFLHGIELLGRKVQISFTRSQI